MNNVGLSISLRETTGFNPWSFIINLMMTINDMFKKDHNKPKQILSLDFSGRRLSILWAQYGCEGTRILAGAIREFGDILKQQQQAADFIREFIQAHNILGLDTVVSISDYSAVAVRHFNIPVIPDNEIEDAIKWQVKDANQPDSSAGRSAYSAWRIVGNFTGEDGEKKNRIVFMSVKPELMQFCLWLINTCRLDPVFISSAVMNYANIVRKNRPDQPGLAVLDIGDLSTNLWVYTKGVEPVFARELSFSGGKLAGSLTQVLSSEKGRIEFSLEQAERIKQELGVPLDIFSAEADSRDSRVIFSLMRPLLEELTRQLRLSFDYIAANFQIEPPKAVYLTGSGSKIRNIDRYLEKELALPVRPLALTADIMAQSPLGLDRTAMASAAGALFFSPAGLNLLPREIKLQKAACLQKRILRLALLTVLALSLVCFFLLRLRANDYAKRIENAAAYLETTRDILTLKQGVEQRRALVDQLRQGRVPVDRMLKMLGGLLSGNLVLDELTFSQSQHKLNLKGTIKGTEASAEAAVSQTLDNIVACGFFDSAKLESLKRISGVIEVKINCDIAH